MRSKIIQNIKSFLVIVFLLFTFFVLTFKTAFSAQQKSYLQSATVHVSTQAKTNSEAKELALKESKKQAIVKALRRSIIKSEDLDFLLKDLDTLAGKFVESYSLKNERVSMIKYEADITINFHKDDLKNWLTTQNIEFIENIPLNFLIIPIETQFFNSMNGNIWSTKQWGAAWEEAQGKSYETSINFKLPKGDFEDIANITISNLLYKKNPNTINQILDKYQTTSILIVEIMNINEQNLGIRITDLDNYKSYETSYTMNQDLLDTENYKFATDTAIDEIFKIAKTKNMNIEEKEVKTDLEFYISNLEDKIKIKQSLSKTKGISNFTEKKSSLKTVLFEITYNKNEEKKILEKLLSMKHNFMVLSKEIKAQENNDQPSFRIPSQEEHLAPKQNSIIDEEAEQILRDIRNGNGKEQQIQPIHYNEEETLERLIVPEKAEYTF